MQHKTFFSFSLHLLAISSVFIRLHFRHVLILLCLLLFFLLCKNAHRRFASLRVCKNTDSHITVASPSAASAGSLRLCAVAIAQQASAKRQNRFGKNVILFETQRAETTSNEECRKFYESGKGDLNTCTE